MKNKILTRKQRIALYLNEYYFGQNVFIRLMRLFFGPLLPIIGFLFLQAEQSITNLILAGVFIINGIYYTMKPFLWLLYNNNSLQDAKLKIEINEDDFNISEKGKLSEMKWTDFTKVAKRKTYYAFTRGKNNKFYIPFTLFSESEMAIINQNLKK